MMFTLIGLRTLIALISLITQSLQEQCRVQKQYEDIRMEISLNLSLDRKTRDAKSGDKCGSCVKDMIAVHSLSQQKESSKKNANYSANPLTKELTHKNITRLNFLLPCHFVYYYKII